MKILKRKTLGDFKAERKRRRTPAALVRNEEGVVLHFIEEECDGNEKSKPQRRRCSDGLKPEGVFIWAAGPHSDLTILKLSSLRMAHRLCPYQPTLFFFFSFCFFSLNYPNFGGSVYIYKYKLMRAINQNNGLSFATNIWKTSFVLQCFYLRKDF